MKLLDCTLRDGGNVVGKGYNIEYTKMMIEGLIKANIKTIEMGNCVGIGMWKSQGMQHRLRMLNIWRLFSLYVNQAEDRYVLWMEKRNRRKYRTCCKVWFEFFENRSKCGRWSYGS